MSQVSGLDQPPVELDGIKAERRHLTVLFCDMVGSSALSTRLDPEDLRHILRAFQNCCGGAISDFDGHIARYMGDGILAYFGFPAAHEDDPERAVQAGLQMVRAVSALSFPAVPPIAVRVGIATGLVVVGDLIGEGPSREFALIGEAPNLAARLQQMAEPNNILVASSTRRLLGNLFELADLGDHSISGFDSRIRVWRVVKPSSATDRFEAHRSSQLTPLVGRERELAFIEARYNKIEQGNGQFITISGEPGIGKSRLVIALKDRLKAKIFCPPSFQCSSYYTSTAWYPFVRYLEDAAGIDFDTPPALRLDKLAALVDRLCSGKSDSIVPLLAALLSIPTGDRWAPLELTPQQQKNRTYAAILTLLKAQANRQPILLVFEDVHWIDPTSRELLEWIRDHIQAWRMLVILLFRPEFSLSPKDHPHSASLTLNRLDAAQVATMVEAVAAKSLSPTIVHQIVSKTDGIPLFVEEMTKTVLESGTWSGGKTGPEPTLGVPDTLHDSLMARLDQFSSKSVAQLAAAIGREFSFELLLAIAPLSELDLRSSINRLLSSGLVLRHDHALTETYVFNHALVRDEAYASLLRDERRDLHTKIAHALCERFGEVAEASPELVAYHFTEAGELKPAIDHWLKAGRQATKRSAFVEATRIFQIALRLVAELPATLERNKLELNLQHWLGSALSASKGFGAAETSQAFNRALELCRETEDASLATSVFNGLIGVHVARGEFEQSRALAEELLARARRKDDPTSRLMGHRALGMSLFLIGELPAARSHLLISLARHGPTQLAFTQDFKATAQAYLALTSVLLGDLSGGLAHGREAVTHAEELRHPHSICYALSFLAGAHVLCREPAAAHPIAERTVALSREYGFPLWLAGGQMLRGWSRFGLGDVEQGLAEIRESVSALEAAGAPIWVQFARYLLAETLAEAGQADDAMKIIDQTLIEIGGTSGRWYEAELHRLKGDLLLNQRDASLSERCYEAAIAVSARQGACLWQLRATNSLGSLWSAQGKRSQVHDRLAPLYAAFDKEILTADLRNAKALLSETA